MAAITTNFYYIFLNTYTFTSVFPEGLVRGVLNNVHLQFAG